MAQRIGFTLGLAAILAAVLLPAPGGLGREGWLVAGLVVWMAAWWMTEAVPLTATALLPFVVLPFAGVGRASEVASDYYSPILFLILGGAFLALAIERTGLHRRLAIVLLDRVANKADGSAAPMQLLLAFMAAAAILSNIISNTSTTLIMMPMVLAVIAGGESGTGRRGTAPDSDGEAIGQQSPAPSSGAIGQTDTPSSSAAIGHQEGLAGALPMALAFAASIGRVGYHYRLAH